MLVPFCNTPNFTALNIEALQVMSRFCGCPEAKSLVFSISKQVPIKIRLNWIKSFQSIYCKNHPQDSRSCSIKTTDLCKYYTPKDIDAMDIPELTKYTNSIVKKTCSLFSTFSENFIKMKGYKKIVSMMKYACPEVLKKSQPAQKNDL